MLKKVGVKSRIYSVLLWVFVRSGRFVSYGIYLFPSKEKADGKRAEVRFELGGKSIFPAVHKQLQIRLARKTYMLGWYKVLIDPAVLMDAGIHNSLKFIVELDEALYYSGVRNNPFFQVFMSLCMWRYIVNLSGKSVFIRLSPSFRTIFTVRNTVISDQKENQLKLTLAGLLSMLLFWLPEKYRPILMYEKESEKFEESASILFSYINAKDHGNVYYVIAKDALGKYSVPKQLSAKLLLKGSFKHYFYFFLCRKFIGTEAPAHAVDLRVAHLFAVLKLWLNRMQFIFLQHGVMYMVSLASESRKMFRRGKLYPVDTKIVVSSDLEAEHFIKDGNYLPDDLYVTGLPKFDSPVHNVTARSIVIMPTWRPWEYNLVGSDTYQQSGYYIMLKTIVDAIPQELKENIIVLPHPLFAKAFRNSDLNQYMVFDQPYEEILQNCKLLITDYSSISYDAFNRGCGVIFWWSDKDECMEQYGGHLMLTEELAFGPVVYSPDELSVQVERLYVSGPVESYQNNFRKLVFDFQGKSTETLYNKLVQDGII